MIPRIAAFLIAICAIAPAIGSTGARAQGVPKFEIADSPIQLEGPARPGIYLGGVGREAGFFGYETGRFEAWSWPVKLFHDFELAFKIPDYTEPIPGASVARQVIVRPEMMTVVYSHATFTVRQHLLAPLNEPGIIVLLDVSAAKPLEIVASFKADLDLMWPAGIGGQYAIYRAEQRRFLLSESRREYNAYIGSPYTTEGSTHPAHAAPDAPSVFRIAVDGANIESEFIPIVIAGGIMPRDSVNVIYERLLESAQDYYDQRVEHAREIRERFASIDSPDPTLDLALEWAKVNLDESLVCNPDLGCGLVAGYGNSGRGNRPGFGWFFGGDASINVLGILPYGGFALARAGLDFQRRNAREDGKMPHEVTQSATRTRENWYTDFPYAYYHADTTPYWVVALYQYWLQTADTAFVRESWDAVVDAYRWGLASDSDGDMIVDNTAAGLGAVEVGALGAGLHQDIYLAAIWVESLRATADLAEAIGDAGLAEEAGRHFETAQNNLEREYYVEDSQVYAFGVLEGGRTNPAITVWPATAMSFKLLSREHAQRNLDALASHRLSTEWGSRMLDSESPLYDPLQYNMGTVWGFVTGFASWALYNYDRPHGGFAGLWANAQSTFSDALGRNPELRSGAYHRTLDTTVPHQFFATSMIPTPLLRGTLGLSADAPRNSVTFAPSLPADWSRLGVSNYPVGASRLNIRLERETAEDGTTELVTDFGRTNGGPSLHVRYEAGLPPGSQLVQVRVDDQPAAVEASPGLDAVRVPIEFTLDAQTVVAVEYRPGIGVAPPRPKPAEGAPASTLRVIRYRYDEARDEYVLLVEGRGGHDYELELLSPLGTPRDCTAGGLTEIAEGHYRLALHFDGPAERYVEQEIRFKNPSEESN
jgi:glycogen debranching enzyme